MMKDKRGTEKGLIHPKVPTGGLRTCSLHAFSSVFRVSDSLARIAHRLDEVRVPQYPMRQLRERGARRALTGIVDTDVQ